MNQKRRPLLDDAPISFPPPSPSFQWNEQGGKPLLSSRESPLPQNISIGRTFVEAQDRLVDGVAQNVRVVEAGNLGKGLIATRDIAAGERIFGILEGWLSDALNTTGEALWGNWNGVDCGVEEVEVGGRKEQRKIIINPADSGPLRWLNHSCAPNAGRNGPYIICAMRSIRAREPITIYYSTLEINPQWTMPCACGTSECRKRIRSIHSLTTEQADRYWPFIPQFMRAIYSDYLISTLGEEAGERMLQVIKAHHPQVRHWL